MTKGFNLKNGIHYLIGYRLEWDAAFDPAGMPDSLPEGIKSIIGDICTRYQYQVMQMRKSVSFMRSKEGCGSRNARSQLWI